MPEQTGRASKRVDQPLAPRWRSPGPSRSGYIYVLGNMYMSDVYKIGRTKRCPYQRAMELSAGSGIPFPFDVLYFAEVADALEAESDLHHYFDHTRVTAEREFFAADLREIIERVSALCVGRYGPPLDRITGTH